MSLNASNPKPEMSCYSILQQIDKLKQEKKINFLEKVGVLVTTGSYYISPSKEVEAKIQILKLKLSECR